MSIAGMSENSKPVSIMLYVADICNLKCNYCYNMFPRSSKIISLRQVLKFLTMHHEVFGRQMDVLLIGGEPTLHPEFMQLLKTLHSSCQFVETIDVFTNFTADLKTYLEMASLNVNLAISYHSCCGFDFAEKLLELSHFSKIKKNVSEVSLMFEPGNSIELTKILKKIINPFRNVIKIWPLYTKLGQFEYTIEEKKTFSTLEKMLSPSSFCKTIIEDVQKEYEDSHIGHYCTAGIDSLYVHSNGNVWRCQNDFFYNKAPLFNIDSVSKQNMIESCQAKLCDCQFCRHGNFDVSIL